MTYVFLVQANNKVTVRAITIGTTEGDDSEVTSRAGAGRRGGDDGRRQAAGRHAGGRALPR